MSRLNEKNKIYNSKIYTKAYDHSIKIFRGENNKITKHNNQKRGIKILTQNPKSCFWVMCVRYFAYIKFDHQDLFYLYGIYCIYNIGLFEYVYSNHDSLQSNNY